MSFNLQENLQYTNDAPEGANLPLIPPFWVNGVKAVLFWPFQFGIFMEKLQVIKRKATRYYT